ncbi:MULTISPECIES: hypothetical protein [unclassified Streptomyces]|uniref:SCO4983 family protein n=1 Tax=unclassified Streptomyces TaxID=2593676 RepID=UPI00225927CA|nr:MULTISPECIES: hypothetical protein [unclassified Streptomyces]MCX4410504.1 hypothetical protein [Streptomyces sp. NBC_01764]MCX5186937.1 hypothetical protein [Streptomyces sp. NBC_00268]
MYEPIRTKSVHTTGGTPTDFPHRSREEELDIQLAGHLAALLAVTDEIRAIEPSADLDAAAQRLAEQVARLREGVAPVRASAAVAHELVALHQRAHALAGRALVVAASRADTAVAILAAERMDAHAPAAEPRALAAR